MQKFAINDIDDNILSEAAKCETAEEVRELLASHGLDYSAEDTQKLFDYTRFVELEEDDLENVAGGCDTAEAPATTSQSDCDEQQS